MKWVVKILLVVFLFPFFMSCSPQSKLNRVIKKQERLLRKYPELIKKRDTVFVYDTIIKPKEVVKFKPIYVGSNTTDTIYQDNTRIIYSVQHDTLELDVLCPPDTVFKEAAVITETVHKEVRKMNNFQKIFFWLGVVCAAAIVSFVGIKIYKPF